MATGSEMVTNVHPAAPHFLPPFFTPAGESDWLLIAMGVFVMLAVVGVGVLYLKLHHLPDHLAHSGQKVQYEIVAVLCLIALFTHNHAFWIIALLLALIPFPDFSTPMNLMAASLARMSGLKKANDESPEPGPDARSGELRRD